MGTIIAIVGGIVMLMILVVLHELGHFWAAKKLGVKVLEFGVGIPPKAVRMRTDKDGTDYTLNWIPLGGFVRLKGEDPINKEEFLASDSLITASLWRKIIILLGGITMNFLITYLIFVIVFVVGVRPIQVIPDASAPVGYSSRLLPTNSSLQSLGYVDESINTVPVVVQHVATDSDAQKLGLRPGDHIVSVAGIAVNPLNFSAVLQSLKGQSLSLLVSTQSGSRTIVYECIDECVLGVAVAYDQNKYIKPLQFGWGSWSIAWQELKAQTRFTLLGLRKIGSSLVSLDVKKTGDGLKRMSGPAGVIKIGQTILLTRGRGTYLAFAGLISLSLALFNLLPIPALDGGRVVGSIIQAVGRFKPQKYFVIENYINMFFFLLLMGLGIYILGQDLVRAWGLFGG